MSPLRAWICVILFGVFMYGFNYLLHLASDSYGILGIGAATAVILGIMLVTGKWLGADFS